jgi:Flp pilus assembly protein TadD
MAGHARPAFLSSGHRMQGTVPHRNAATAMTEVRRALASGDLATAERVCAQVLAGAPDCGSAWAVLAETALQRGRPDAAIVCADRAVDLTPGDPITHILRAKCLFVSGEAGQALAAAETASNIVGSTPEALDALGAIFGLLGRHQRALELFRRAVAARPCVPQYLFNLAATERMTGLLDAAEAHCDAAIALDPHCSLAHYLRSDLRTQTADRNHTTEMETLLGDAALTWHDRVVLRFALGKEFEDLDEHRRAFDHVKAGSDLQRRSISYDSGAEIAEIEGIIRTQTRTWLASCLPGFTGAGPVFVAGLPRTGTTLVERILASHSALISAGETNAFAVALSRATQTTPKRFDGADIGRRYIDSVGTFGVPPDRRFIDKTLRNYLYCALIHAALPRAKIILVRRHPLDACWAIYKALFRGKFLFSYDQIELADYYLAFRRLAQHWKSILPSDVLLEVNYEDIVRDQATESRRLIDFTGLPWEDEVLRFHKSRAPSATASAVQVRRPIYFSSLGKWRPHAEQLTPLRARLASEIPEAELA